MIYDRRAALLRLANWMAFTTAAAAFTSPGPIQAAAPLRLTSDPFALGVASGDPSPDGVVIWTRICPDPLDPRGLPPETYEVGWTIAKDPQFRQILQRGRSYATPSRAHAVHVELRGLEPDQEYWYRFDVAGAQSPVGRAVTLPTPSAEPRSLKIAWASCQHWEQGWFGIYQDMIAWDPRLIFHLGDYIYESSWGPQVRRHPGNDPSSLEDYRVHHAVYKLDPDLQAAHAHTSWCFTWDDHEVSNDYTGDAPEDPRTAASFAARKAAAYQAYLEHLPISRRSLATRLGVRLYQRIVFGRLASFYVLDTRQFRSPRPCLDPSDWRSHAVSCAEVDGAARTMLGADQEYWLQWVLGDGATQWNTIVQTTLFSRLDDRDAAGRRLVGQTGWDAYPAARQRILDLVARRNTSDVVVIGGDKHAFFAADVRADAPGAPVLGAEFVTSSVTSVSAAYDRYMRVISRGDNGHIRHFDDRRRGYARAEITPAAWAVDFRAADSVFLRTPAMSTQARFVVASGRPGVQLA